MDLIIDALLLFNINLLQVYESDEKQSGNRKIYEKIKAAKLMGK